MWAGWNDTALTFADFHQASSLSRHHDSRRHSAAFLATDTNDAPQHKDEDVHPQPILAPRLAEAPVSDTSDWSKWIGDWLSILNPKRKVEPRANLCAKHCNMLDTCIGFAEDEQMCIVYTSVHQPLKTLPNWMHSPGGSVGFRRTLKIVQSNNDQP